MSTKPHRNPRSIGKALRFKIFARDGFTCRYCGRQSDAAPLVIDHVIPVCKGGTADPENLITACHDCNAGKSGRLIGQSAPTETDRLRLNQEMKEQVEAAKAVQMASQARREMRQDVVDFWCDVTGRREVSSATIYVICSYVEKLGAELVFRWIEIAASKVGHSDVKMGRYISGIRRHYLEELEQPEEFEAF